MYDVINKKFNKWDEIKGYNDFPEFGSVYTFLQDPIIRYGWGPADMD